LTGSYILLVTVLIAKAQIDAYRYHCRE
jgi:hypothetical protein